MLDCSCFAMGHRGPIARQTPQNLIPGIGRLTFSGSRRIPGYPKVRGGTHPTFGLPTTRPQPYLRTFTFHNAITGSHQVDILKGYLWAETLGNSRGKSIAAGGTIPVGSRSVDLCVF